MGYTVMQLTDRLRSNADAYLFMEELRWGDGLPVCPHCTNEGATYLEPKNGTARKTSGGKTMSERRVWKCWDCRKQFSVITGTVMHGTKVSLRVWVLVIFEMCASKNGIAAREVERKYGVCARTAWHMMHRLREAMTDGGLVQSMRGVVVADETWIGGNPANRHGAHRLKGKGGQGYTDKTPVLSLIDADTGEVRSRIVPDVTGATLSKAMSEMGVDKSATVLYTDSAASYRSIRGEFQGHEAVNHFIGEYVRYEGAEVITSNAAENFFSQLKRSLDGTHHHVSKEHLSRYLSEFGYRFSTKAMTDTQRMQHLFGQIHGKRLTYKRVTA
jgi:transposase-like protein